MVKHSGFHQSLQTCVLAEAPANLEEVVYGLEVLFERFFTPWYTLYPGCLRLGTHDLALPRGE